jgi:hypothetical protein
MNGAEMGRTKLNNTAKPNSKIWIFFLQLYPETWQGADFLLLAFLQGPPSIWERKYK